MRKIFFIIIISFSIVSNYRYEYPQPINGYFSQKGQDKFLNEKIFKGKQNGIFVEVGAHDGVSFSNSYFFEKYLNWTGICIEPNPGIFTKLIQNRNCICLNDCIGDPGTQVPFLKCTGYMLEMYSGLLSNLDPRHLERIENEANLYGGTVEIIYVNCVTLKEIFKKNNLSYIDFLSIDIEGGEEAAIKSIDFDEVKINIIVVENNFNEDKVKNYLLSKGYLHIMHLGKDDIYQLERSHE